MTISARVRVTNRQTLRLSCGHLQQAQRQRLSGERVLARAATVWIKYLKFAATMTLLSSEARQWIRTCLHICFVTQIPATRNTLTSRIAAAAWMQLELQASSSTGRRRILSFFPTNFRIGHLANNPTMYIPLLLSSTTDGDPRMSQGPI